MKKIIYIANIRLPTEKAHGIQIMKMCEAFADGDASVELVVPKRFTAIKQDPFDYYNVRRNFNIKKLWCVNPTCLGNAGFIIGYITFAFSVVGYALFQNGIFYTRDESYAFLIRLMGKQVVWEAHMGQRNLLTRMLMRMKVPFVVITKGLADMYARLGVVAKSIHIAPDAVDIAQFDIRESREEARVRLGFKKEEKIILYTGHLYSWKGTDTLAQAARLLPKDMCIYFVGGTDNDVASFKKKYGETENIKILGRKPHREMPLYMRVADILVIPNSAKEDISRLYTSPMKLFEYMASGTPIVASDLPSLREILDPSIASFFVPDDSENLSRAIVEAFKNSQKSVEKALAALEKVKKYSWQNRAKGIIDFLCTKN